MMQMELADKIGSLPTLSSAWFTAALLNHIWQSTAVFLVVWILTAMLRRSQANIRYRLWLTVSVKFMLPFVLLSSAGRGLYSLYGSLFPVTTKHGALASGVIRLSMPFQRQYQTDGAGSSLYSARIPSVHAGIAFWLLCGVWLCGACIVGLQYLRDWWRVRALCRGASPVAQISGIRILSHTDNIEPGAIGILRPRILLPASIMLKLSQAQLDAILAHELCHIRRRDNLTAFLHVLVTAAFWFHPAVWMVRARMLEERELACDEAVLLAGNHPETYAESILGVCRWYVEAPVAHMPGVTGSALKQRIVRIMSGSVAERMGCGSRAVVVSSAALVLCFVLSPGLVSDPVNAMQQGNTDGANLPRYAVVSIHPTQRPRGSSMFTPEGFHAEAESPRELVQLAFRIDKGYELDRLPAWANGTRYAVDAKVDASDVPVLKKLSFRQCAEMMQPVLADRFHLKAHWESRMLPVYLLVVAKGGSRLKLPSPDDAAHPAKLGDATGGPGSIVQGVNGQVIGQGVPVRMIVQVLNAYTERLIVDKTGLSGAYDFSIQLPRPRPAPDGSYSIGSGSEAMVSAEQAAEADQTPSATLFTAVADMGMELKPVRAPVQVLVIDNIQPPTEN